MMASPPGTLPSFFYMGQLLLSQPLHSAFVAFPDCRISLLGSESSLGDQVLTMFSLLPLTALLISWLLTE